MRVLVVETMKEAYEKEIDGSLESLNAIVKGTIQAVYPFRDNVALVCNDDGKILELPLNRDLPEIQDVIAGPFFVCGVEGQDFVSLTDAQMKRYQKRFREPELILFMEGGHMVIKIPDAKEKDEELDITFQPAKRKPRGGR